MNARKDSKNFAGDEDARRLADMVCPECSRPFRLRFDIPSEDDTLVIGSCGSGGIYSVAIRCPHCYYQEDLC